MASPSNTEESFEHFDAIDLYTPDELDELCEELNCQGETIWLWWDFDQDVVLGWSPTYQIACEEAGDLNNVIIRPFLTGR